MASTFETLLLSQYAFLLSSTPQLLSTATLTAPTTASVTYTPTSPVTRILCLWGARSSFAATAVQLYLQMNGDTAAHYTYCANQNNNTTVAGAYSNGLATAIQIGTITAASGNANYWASGMFVVEGADQTTHAVTAQGTGAAVTSNTNMYSGTYSGMWAATTPITSLTLSPASGSFIAGSQFTFYGTS